MQIGDKFKVADGVVEKGFEAGKTYEVTAGNREMVRRLSGAGQIQHVSSKEEPEKAAEPAPAAPAKAPVKPYSGSRASR